MDPTSRPTPAPTPELVLAATIESHQLVTQVEIGILQLAVDWVRLHPGDEVDTRVEWAMRELEIAGDGAPTIDEGAVAEFALAIGRSTDSGRRYLGEAVELCHRLPRIWRRVLAGEVAAWKARRVARATMPLPPEAAAAVDRAVYFVLKRCSFAEIDRQVEKARKEHDPDETERRRVAALEKRHFDVDLDHVSYDGLVHVDGELDLADAMALEDWVKDRAATLDPELPLDVRRSMAAGMVSQTGEDQVQREVILFAHARPGQAMADVDNTRTTVTAEQVEEWCTRAGTKVTVRPVIDLAEELSTDSYTPTEVMSEQVKLRFPECPFPQCNRPSRPGQKTRRRARPDAGDQHGSDLDHRTEWPHGATTTSNLAPPCRTHHRLKTFTDWTYEYLPGTGFIWTSPLGQRHTD